MTDITLPSIEIQLQINHDDSTFSSCTGSNKSVVTAYQRIKKAKMYTQKAHSLRKTLVKKSDDRRSLVISNIIMPQNLLS